MAKIGRNSINHVVFAFCVIYIKNILNENINTFRALSQVPVRLYFFLFNKVIANVSFKKVKMTVLAFLVLNTMISQLPIGAIAITVTDGLQLSLTVTLKQVNM